MIDAWADLLNYEERLRSVSSPRRFFFPDMLIWILQSASVLNEAHYVYPTRYQWFKRNIQHVTGDDDWGRKIRKIDMVIFFIIYINKCVNWMKINHASKECVIWTEFNRKLFCYKQLFFPVILGVHYTCVVYNLKNLAYDVLDNMIVSDPTMAIYEPHLSTLVRIMFLL